MAWAAFHSAFHWGPYWAFRSAFHWANGWKKP